MLFQFSLGLVAALVGAANADAPTIKDYPSEDISNGNAYRNVTREADENMQNYFGPSKGSSCTYDLASERKEWRTMEEATRKSFTDAVTCLINHAPTRMTDAEKSSYPGVKSRHDEYVATHINYTLHVHSTADFFAWHRTFIHFWEQDLKNLCGYTGVLPYWNWADDADAPQNSPLFSGDEFSMGSNGEYIAGRGDTWLAQQDVTYPPGTGGGCVKSGPFSDITVNLGPLDLPGNQNVNSSYDYNPRCLERDFNGWFTSQYNSYYNLTHTLLDNADIASFQANFQGYGGANPNDKFGCHGGGHWATGGSMSDFHSSPADPLFFLHHGMVDRTWTIWQNLDSARRQKAISGTSTLLNNPESPEMTLDDMLPFGLVADDVRFGDVMDTFAGPFCYRYQTA